MCTEATDLFVKLGERAKFELAVRTPVAAIETDNRWPGLRPDTSKCSPPGRLMTRSFVAMFWNVRCLRAKGKSIPSLLFANLIAWRNFASGMRRCIRISRMASVWMRSRKLTIFSLLSNWRSITDLLAVVPKTQRLISDGETRAYSDASASV